MGSFYGGRRGASAQIVKTYNSYSEMETDFSSSDCSVGYNEYVIVNENDQSILYKKTFTTPEKIGSLMPNKDLKVIDFDIALKSYEDIKSEAGAVEKESTLENGDIIPGKEIVNGEIKYNDKLYYIYNNILNGEGDTVISEIGVKVPYSIIDFSADILEGDNDASHPLLSQVFEKDEKGQNIIHPFSSSWHFNIPRGNPGSSIKNLRVLSADYISKQKIALVNRPQIPEGDIQNSIQYLIYDEYNPVTDKTSTYYLGNSTQIEDISLSDNGTLTIKYEGGRIISFDRVIKWIKDISVSDDGTITIEYNDDNSDIFEKKIRSISNLSFDENGKFIISDNQNNVINQEIKWIKDVQINEQTQKINITYNILDSEGKNITTEIGSPLNYIVKTAIDDNYNLLIYNSDPEIRKNLGSSAVTYDGLEGWQNLGNIKEDSGILIGKNYENLNNYSQENIIRKLNTDYPKGLLNSDKGKVITVGANNQIKSFYAFDYDQKTWYFLGKIGDLSRYPNSGVFVGKSDFNTNDKLESLNVGGFWFVTYGEDDET